MSMFESRIFRVLKGDSVVGAAFLVADQLVATCAHVVRSAGRKAGETVTLKLMDGNRINAQVLPEYWRAENAEDVAILHLEAPLKGQEPLILGSSLGTRGHGFSTFGFPKPSQELAGRGEVIGEAILSQIKLLQLDSRQVTPGFSGAPVFDEVTKRVVGMVVAITPPDEYSRQGTTAFAIPSETLREICSELQLTSICPYRSLDVFNEEDTAFFFGRERVIQKLLESLKREPRFLAMLGPSGSGKSSVIRAGLIPALKQGKLLGSNDWGVLTIRPEDEPFEQLENEGLITPQNGLAAAVQNWLTENQEKSRLILVVDQFEELLVSTPAEIRQKFIAELSNLLDAPLAITLIITMRDDFYSRFLQDAPKLGGWIERGLVNIPLTITEDELEAIVTGPAETAGLTFEEGLAEAIVADVLTRDQNDSAHITVLPLLEFALTQLWELRQDNILTHDAYRHMEGVAGGLAKWANAVYDALDKNERSMARMILELLVHPADEDQGIPDIRQARPVPELIRENEVLMQKTIDKLVKARLLTIKRDPRTGEDIIEIIHDALLVEWGSLKSWLEEDRPSLQIQQQLNEAADEWKAHRFDRSYLFRGQRLEEVQNWLTQHKKALSRLEREFFKASLLEKNRQRLTTRVFWSMATILLLSLLVIGPGRWEYHELLRQQALDASPLIKVEGGNIIFGTNNPERQYDVGEPAETSVYVPTLWVEATEVTFYQYYLCVRADLCKDPLFTNPVDLDAMAEHPVTYVTIYQAMDYCKWVGRHLPDTYEWELAARGIDGRPWPWYDSNLPSDDRHNLVSDDKGIFITFETSPTDTAPVGTHQAGATPEGILDLYGNVWEWTTSTVELSSNVITAWDGNKKDVLLIQRGGAWDAALDRITQIRPSTSAGSDFDSGFRCVQTTQP